ncbi:MAG: hypothetical protein VX835_00290 [Pseudomonadota bacterium]|nr:hypothetical protein [Pseudomonadota bacterium]
MRPRDKKTNSYSNIKYWLFFEGILDVVVSCLYRVVATLNDVLKNNSINTFVIKLTGYFTNKLSRYYVKYFDQKNKVNHSNHFWPIAMSIIVLNLIFDFSYNFYFVIRALSNKISWLSNIMVLCLAYAYMILSSLDSCYSNSVAWYGILSGGFDDSSIRFSLNIFFALSGLIEAILSSLYFMVTTEMTLLWGMPICILLYFLPPFLQKYIDASVITNCVSNSEDATYNFPMYKMIAGYVVLANLIGLCFQLSSFTANIASGLPWLSATMVTNVGIAFVAFYVLHVLITNGYTWAQFILGVNFVDKPKISNINPVKNNPVSANILQQKKISIRKERNDTKQSEKLTERNNYGKKIR